MSRHPEHLIQSRQRRPMPSALTAVLICALAGAAPLAQSGDNSISGFDQITLASAAVAMAGDAGARRHAQGTYDTSSATYVVARGDDLEAIAARFGMTLAALKAQNGLTSDALAIGQTLKVAGPAEQTGSGSAAERSAAIYTVISGEEGSPAAKATIDGEQLPSPPPEFGGVIQDNALQSTPW